MNKNLLFAIALSSAGLSFVGWRVHAVRTRATPHFAIVEDPSLSHPAGCISLMGLAQRTLQVEGVTRDSTLSILVLGDTTTSDEPWKLGEYFIPRTDSVMESPDTTLRRQESVLADIHLKCQAIRPTAVSPIFLGVKQAIGDLRARGCGENSRCKLFVDSDLRENVEPSIRSRLEAGDNRRQTPLPILGNDGVEVTFCGLATTTDGITDSSSGTVHGIPRHDSHREDRVTRVWQSMFTQPQSTTFEPYCPTAIK